MPASSVESGVCLTGRRRFGTWQSQGIGELLRYTTSRRRNSHSETPRKTAR